MQPVIFFLHIPKTAGTSLRHIFEFQYPAPQLVNLYPPLDAQTLETAREGLRKGGRVVYGHLNFGIHEVLGFPGKYLTLLRDPADRVISYFRHNLSLPQAAHYQLIRDGMSLAEFVDRRITFETNNHMTRILAGHTGTGHLDDDRVLEQALHNLREHFLFAGVTERFDESIQAMGRCLGWQRSFPRQPPRVNVSSANSRLEVDAETRRLIERENRLDLALYRAVAESLDRG